MARFLSSLEGSGIFSNASIGVFPRDPSDASMDPIRTSEKIRSPSYLYRFSESSLQRLVGDASSIFVGLLIFIIPCISRHPRTEHLLR